MLTLINDRDQWNAYVDNHPDGTFCHRYEWRNVIEDTYGLEVQMWGLLDQNRLKGILPTCLMRNLNRPWKWKAVSLPFLDYGGILADDPDSTFELFTDYKKVCASPSQFRERSPRANSLLTNSDRGNCSFQLPLDADPKTTFAKLRSSVRRDIQKANQSGMIFRPTTSLNEFYEVYAKNVHDLGTPVHAFRWFSNISRFFPKDHRIFIVSLDNRILGGMICFGYKGIFSNPWTAILRETRPLKVGSFLYWGAIQFACENKFQIFDFLRSKINSGPYHFKKRWGGKEIPLYYFSDDPKEKPSDRTDKYGKLIWCWQKMPLSLSNLLGPKIRPYID